MEARHPLRILPHVFGMLVLGCATLAGFAALVEWRVGQPLERSASAGATRPASLAEGIADATKLAAERLTSERSAAMQALEAAKRASRLAAEAFGGAFVPVHEAVMRARRELENGRAKAARRLLEQASARALPSPAAKVPRQLERYEGATLIDAAGVRIGKVATIRADHGRVAVRLALGPRDVLGFIDLGGRNVSVAPEALVYGKPAGAVGATLVAWTGG